MRKCRYQSSEAKTSPVNLKLHTEKEQKEEEVKEFFLTADEKYIAEEKMEEK